MSVEEAWDAHQQDEEGKDQDGKVVLGIKKHLGQSDGDIVAAGSVGVAILLEVLVSSLVGQDL